MKFLDKHSFYHGCINPNNILINCKNSFIQITMVNSNYLQDNRVNDMKFYTLKQPLIFQAPETTTASRISIKSDLYSLGALMFFLSFYEDLFENSPNKAEDAL